MSAADRRVRQWDKSSYPTEDRRVGPAERRVANYRHLLKALAKDHVICGGDPCDFAALLAALRRPTVTEGEIARAIKAAWVASAAADHPDNNQSYESIAARVAVAMLK